jgi:hypothetical protein
LAKWAAGKTVRVEKAVTMYSRIKGQTICRRVSSQISAPDATI